MAPLRALIGLLALFFAHWLGRSAVRLCQRREPRARTIAWALRTTVCLVAVWWVKGLDLLTAAALALAAASCAAGAYLELRPRKQDRLTELIFPRD